MKELEPIIKYRMDPMESKAYKIALMWEDECQREIRGEPFVRIKKNTDPRKSSLFKYCFKLARETHGILKDEEIQLYIRAQIQILKSIKQGEIHALIEPHCLVGEKAWKRWKLWKWRFDKIMKSPINPDASTIKTSYSKIKSELESSFNFLKKEGCDSLEKMKSRKDDIKRWFKNGQVSRFYAVMSPWIRKIISNNSEFEFDHIYYRSSISPDVEKFFRDLFEREFDSKEEKSCVEV
jgi:hypothetical protein